MGDSKDLPVLCFIQWWNCRCFVLLCCVVLFCCVIVNGCSVVFSSLLLVSVHQWAPDWKAKNVSGLESGLLVTTLEKKIDDPSVNGKIFVKKCWWNWSDKNIAFLKVCKFQPLKPIFLLCCCSSTSKVRETYLVE